MAMTAERSDLVARVSLSRGEVMVQNALRLLGPHGSLQPIGDIKAALGRVMFGTTVDACLWSLAERGLVDLHRHDFPGGMTEAEKARSLKIYPKSGEPTYYIGAAIRNVTVDA